MALLTKTPKLSFIAGEVSPLIASEVESESYFGGMSQLENWMVDINDGIKMAPGMQYVNDAYNTAEKSRYIPFQFNEEQAYVLEFCDSGMRVIKDGALVLRNIVDSAVYKWTESIAQAGEYHLELLAGGDPGLMEPSKFLENSIYITKGTAGSLAVSEWDYTDNDTLGYSTPYVRLFDTTDPDAQVDGFLQVPFLVATPYPIADVGALNGDARSADVLYLLHGSYNIRKVTRSADNAWTVTELPAMNGPYQVRTESEEDVRVNITFFASSSWTFTADTAIFGDVQVGDCVRLGFPIPGDPSALHWTWYVVVTVTDSTHIIATQQGETSPVYQQVVNPFFSEGNTSWEDHSTPLVPPFASKLSYDFTNKAAVLTDGVGGDAIMEQAVLTSPNVNQIVAINIHTLSTGTAQCILKVGTTSGASDIFLSAALTTTGPYVFTILPTTSLVYISITTSGSTDADVVKINKVELFPVGDEPAGGTEYNTINWGLGSWNATHGFPRYGLVNDQRFIAASTPTKPQTIWVSELGNYEGFGETTPTRASDSFSFFPSTEELNGIRWMIEKDGIKIGTADAVWRVFAPSGGVISPLDIALEVDEAEGSLDLRPIVAHNAIIMTPRGTSPVLEMISSLEAKGFQTRDIASRAAHLFKNRRIVRWAFAKDPDSVIWCILDNGQLLGMTYHRRLTQQTPQGVWAWFTRTCSLGAGYADVAVIPNSSDDNTDDVYFLVNRGTVQAPNYYIEKLNLSIIPQEAAYGLSASSSPYDYRFLDSALTLDNPVAIQSMTQADPVVISSTAHGFLDGDEIRFNNMIGQRGSSLNNQVWEVSDKATNTYQIKDSEGNYYGLPPTPPPGLTNSTGEARKMVTSMAGLDHLEGQTVTAMADGAFREELVVSSGTITLPQAASFANVGLPYSATGESLDIEQGINTQGLKKGFNSVDIYFVESRNCKAYPSNDPTDIQEIEFEDEANGEDPPPLFDGIKSVDIRSEVAKQVRLVFVQDKPLPCHIRRAIIHVEYAGS